LLRADFRPIVVPLRRIDLVRLDLERKLEDSAVMLVPICRIAFYPAIPPYIALIVLILLLSGKETPVTGAMEGDT
jgi:hypothetical protein